MEKRGAHARFQTVIAPKAAWWSASCSVETVCIGSDDATFPSRGVENNGDHLFS